MIDNRAVAKGGVGMGGGVPPSPPAKTECPPPAGSGTVGLTHSDPMGE